MVDSLNLLNCCATCGGSKNVIVRNPEKDFDYFDKEKTAEDRLEYFFAMQAWTNARLSREVFEVPGDPDAVMVPCVACEGTGAAKWPEILRRVPAWLFEGLRPNNLAQIKDDGIEAWFVDHYKLEAASMVKYIKNQLLAHLLEGAEQKGSFGFGARPDGYGELYVEVADAFIKIQLTKTETLSFATYLVRNAMKLDDKPRSRGVAVREVTREELIDAATKLIVEAHNRMNFTDVLDLVHSLRLKNLGLKSSGLPAIMMTPAKGNNTH